jgi:hypothetical protein
MTRYEECKLRILDRAANAPLLNVTTRSLANEYGMPESHLRDQLVHMADSGLIRLSAWDGERDRPHDEWMDSNAFFSNETGKAHIRIRVLSAGAELLNGAFSETC